MSGSLPKAIIYDWDNTLVDTFPLIFEMTNRTREAFGLEPWTDAQARKNIRRTTRDSFPEIYGDRAEDALAFYLNGVRERHLDALVVLPQAQDLIRFCHQMGIKQAVFSNKTNYLLRDEVAQFDPDNRLTTIVGTGDYQGLGKPDPAGLFAAMSALGIEKSDYSNTWYVGDTESDIKTAQSAGVTSVFIENDCMSDLHEIAILRPDYHFKSCVEALAHLKTLS